MTGRGTCRLWGIAVIVTIVLSGEPPIASASHVTPFVAPLRIPKVYSAANIAITMRGACVQVLPGPCTKMWTYDGMFPGPTIRRPSGETTKVTFLNNLPKAVGSTTVHHHGSHSASRFDGQPDDYLIAPGKKFTYRYDFMERGEPERAAFQWYHDHRMDNTGRNVWMGLAGMFVLDDRFDARLPLPKGKYDVPLMVVDRSFDKNNQLDYKFESIGSLGDHLLVNGVATPYFNVDDRTYRFRLLNASNFREYRFELSNGQDMVQIAAESGLLPKPVRRKSIILGPAERAEVVIDFSGHLGENIVLSNTLPGTQLVPAGPAQVMQFRVRHHVSDPSRVPQTLRSVPQFGDPSVTRVFDLAGVPGAGAARRQDESTPPRNILWTINGLPFDSKRVDVNPELGATERWIFVNNTIMQHRIHIHDVDWRIVSRTKGVSVATAGDPDAALSEGGLRETFLVQSGEVVEVLSKFTDHIGRYVFHCHILEHEDNAMMSQFEVVGPGQGDGGIGTAGQGDRNRVTGGARAGGLDRDRVGARTKGSVGSSGVSSDTLATTLASDESAGADGHRSRDGNSALHIALALAVLALGGAAGILATSKSRSRSTKLPTIALALQLGGLGWDMLMHASAGEPLDLLENSGHLVAIAGIVLLGLIVAIPSIPTRFVTPGRRHGRTDRSFH